MLSIHNATWIQQLNWKAAVLVLPLFTIYGCTFSQRAGFEKLDIKVGKGAASVEVADLNMDGRPDLIVANTDDSSVSVLLNIGERKFHEAQGSPFYAGHFPNDINVADFDKDGIPDLANANHERKSFTILLGSGHGQFSAAQGSPFAVQVRPHTHGIISADFDEDGNLDVATDSWAVDSIVILKGDGKGRFSNPIFHATGRHPYQRLRSADFNKDGHADIVTTNLDANSVTILSGNGKGNFDEAIYDAGATPFGVTTGDFNRDGNIDLAVINSPTLANASVGKDGLSILLNDGFGRFVPMQGSPFATGSGPSRIAAGDLNNDGIDDIVVVDYKSHDMAIYYFKEGAVLKHLTIPIGEQPDGVAIADLDGDGVKDIIVTSTANNHVTIFFSSK